MSVWLPSAPCTPGACVERNESVTAVPLAVLRLVAVTAVLLAGIVLLPVGRWIPAGAVRWWCRTVVRASGVRVRLSGATAPTGGVLLVANHISWLDIPLLAAVRPARMLAKSEIRQWPVAGWLTACSGALFIERDRLRALPDTVARIADALRGGAAVTVFPEGSTWCGRAQGHFRRAVFEAALDAGVAVQPVRLGYRVGQGEATTAPAFIGDDSLLSSVWRVVSARGLVAEVRVMEPVTPGSHADRRALAATAQARVWAGRMADRHPVAPLRGVEPSRDVDPIRDMDPIRGLDPIRDLDPFRDQEGRDGVRSRRPSRPRLLAPQPPGVSARVR